MLKNYGKSLKIEKEFVTFIKNKSLAELAGIIGRPLDDIYDLNYFLSNLYSHAVESMFKDEEFLNLPIRAHYSFGDDDYQTDRFLVGDCLNDASYRAIIIDPDYGCEFAIYADTPQFEKQDSGYKTVRDILPLINFMFSEDTED